MSNIITLEDVNATIRTISAVTGEDVEKAATSAESDIKFWLGVRRGLSLVGNETAKVAKVSPIAIRSKETQLAYWNRVRKIAKDRRVPLYKARQIYKQEKDRGQQVTAA